MRRTIVAALIAGACSPAAAQDSQVRITGWAGEPAAPQASRPPPLVLAPGESAYGPVVRPTTRVTGMPKRFRRLTGPTTVAGGVVGKDGVLASVPIAHAVTGHMPVAPERVGGVFSGLGPMQAGPVYAVQLEGKMIWCAPRRSVSKKGQPYWSSDCFVPHPFLSSFYQHGVATGLYVTRLQVGDGAVRSPQVREQPVDFGIPMRMAYVLGKLSKRHADVRLEVQAEGVPAVVWNTGAFWGADGSAALKVLDGEVRLIREGADAVRVETIRPPSLAAESPF